MNDNKENMNQIKDNLKGTFYDPTKTTRLNLDAFKEKPKEKIVYEESEIIKTIKKNIPLAIITILFWGIILFFGYRFYMKNNITISRVSSAFNKSEYVTESNKIDGYNINSKKSGNALVVTVKLDENKYVLEYILEDKVLVLRTKEDPFTAATITQQVLFTIAKIRGQNEKDIITTISSEEIVNYKVDKDGFEVKQEGEYLVAKISLKKPLKLLDATLNFVTVEDLKDFENFLKYDGNYSGTDSGIFIYKNNEEDKITLLISEGDEISNRTYQTILSLIEVIYNKTEVSYFKKNLKKMENKKFGKYEIYLNSNITDFEKDLIGENEKYTKVIIKDTQKEEGEIEEEENIPPKIETPTTETPSAFDKYNNKTFTYDEINKLLKEYPMAIVSMDIEETDTETLSILILDKTKLTEKDTTGEKTSEIDMGMEMFFQKEKTYFATVEETKEEVTITFK